MPGLVDVDLSDPRQVEDVFRAAAPAAVVHAGAMADPDACERDPEMTMRVDRDAPAFLARLCAGTGVRMIHFSTDLVFDGERAMSTEQDEPRPICVYGRAKLEAERAVLAAAPGAVVLRVATVYGRSLAGRPSFLDTLHTALSRGQSVRLFVDQWRTATPLSQLPELIAALLDAPQISGVFHWTGATRASRWDFGVEACRIFGFSETNLQPTRLAEAKFAAPRARDTSLDSRRLSQLIGLPLLTLRQGLELARAEFSLRP